MKLKIPFQWLLDYLETDFPMENIIRAMTSIGIEVENVESRISKSNFFEIVQIDSVEPHPTANLSICTVNSTQIVCGASNVRQGMRCILAKPGAIIPSSMKEIKVTKIRGIVSNGMLCSKAELLLEDESEGIIDLDKDFPGMDDEEIFNKVFNPNGPVITVFVTPNRQDLMSIYGIARELHCFNMGRLKNFSIPEYTKVTKHTKESPLVRVSNYISITSVYAVHIEVNGSHNSKAWLKRRLFDSGIEHKCLLSDISTYILHVFGQQLELFDFEKTGILKISLPTPSEINNTPALGAIGDTNLAGVKLNRVTCVISDKDNKIISIAGVLPSKNSTLEFRSIVMLAARYDEEFIRSDFKEANINNLSFCKDFSRATDTTVSKIALYEACLLIQKMTDCNICEMIEALPKHSYNSIKAIKAPDISFIENSIIDVHQILTNLGFECDEKGEYTQPSWRSEVMLDSSDLLEEVLRYTGFQNIESLGWCPKIYQETICPETNDIYYLVYFLTRLGMTEVSNLHFMSKIMSKVFEPSEDLIITNPMKKDKQYALRNSIMVGIIEILGKYFRNNWKLPGIFEIGKVFEGGEEYEALGIGILPTNFCQWHSSAESQYFKAKEIFETCVESIIGNTRQVPCDRKIFINGCAWFVNGLKIAEFGELDTSLFPYIFGKKIKEPIYIGEINIDRAKRDFNKYIDDNSSFPLLDYSPCQSVIERDVSFYFTEPTYFADAISELKEYLENRCITFSVFDVYPSPIISDKLRSVTLRLAWMLPYSPTSEEIHSVMNQVEELLYKNGCIIKEK